MKKNLLCFPIALLLLLSLLGGCNQDSDNIMSTHTTSSHTEVTSPTISETISSTLSTTETSVFPSSEIEPTKSESTPFFGLSQIPTYSGSPFAEVNDNTPCFTSDELTTQSFEHYSDLDQLGRCGIATASIGVDLMPTEDRNEIGMVKPAGWHTVKYDCVDGRYLYNRCHLIGFQLSGENANVRNLITGTRFMNVQGMLPFENMVADYVHETGNHVMYRVTPMHEGDNLLVSGVLMEAISVEDSGQGICFCVFVYNVQPGITINYETGESSETGLPNETGTDTTIAPEIPDTEVNNDSDYVLNTNTMKFHLPSCSSIGKMSDKNKEYFHGQRSSLIAQGFEPCQKCNP